MCVVVHVCVYVCVHVCLCVCAHTHEIAGLFHKLNYAFVCMCICVNDIKSDSKVIESFQKFSF